MARKFIPSISGSPADDGFALSAGTGAKIPTGVSSSVVSTSSPHPELFALVEPAQGFTVYVNRISGSDANNGASRGSAVATLAKAVGLLAAANRSGTIIFTTGSAGFYDLAAPLHLPIGLGIDAPHDSAVTIRRNFSTPNSRSAWDAVTTAAGTSVSSASIAFTSSDTGRIGMIYGAGINGGTHYSFLTFSSATVCSLSGPTAIARSAATDPNGVKLTVCGDWNRKVSNAAIAAGQSIVTSATAAWTSADIATELVIDGAGQNGQALRSVIIAVNPGANQATILAVASNTVSGKACVIGANFGHAICAHSGALTLRNLKITDTSSANNSIGAALAIYSDDQGTGQAGTASGIDLENVEITSTDPAGAWEHDLDVDGSWAQASGGPGTRRATYKGCRFFGARRPGEQLRLNGAVHHWFSGGGTAPAPTTIRQGIALLDPRKTGGDGIYQTVDIHFAGFEAQADLYTEGQYQSFFGGRLGSVVSGANTANLAPSSDNIAVCTGNGGGSNVPVIAGTNSFVCLGTTMYIKRDGLGSSYLQWIAAPDTPGFSSGVAAFMAVTGSNMSFGVSNAADLLLYGGGVVGVTIKTTQSVLLGKGALATNATDGFPQIPANAGAPTGIPTAQTGFVPFYYDTTNHKLWIYDGGWKGVVVS